MSLLRAWFTYILVSESSEAFRLSRQYHFGGTTMSTSQTFCGIECAFLKSSDIWEFFKFSGIEFGTSSFSVADSSVFSGEKRIDLPETFAPGYFQELNRRSFVGERLVLHLYPAGAAPVEINNYDDFDKSLCEMVVLMYDCYFVEIYCKNQNWLQTLLQTAESIEGAEVYKKYKETDRRTVFYV